MGRIQNPHLLNQIHLRTSQRKRKSITSSAPRSRPHHSPRTLPIPCCVLAKTVCITTESTVQWGTVDINIPFTIGVGPPGYSSMGGGRSLVSGARGTKMKYAESTQSHIIPSEACFTGEALPIIHSIPSISPHPNSHKTSPAASSPSSYLHHPSSSHP